MADTTPSGNPNDDALAAWVTFAVNQANRIDDPRQPNLTPADSRIKYTAKTANTDKNFQARRVANIHGEEVAGTAGAPVRLRDGIAIADGPTIRAGSGAPEGVESAPPGSTWVDVATGDIYRKDSGTGNTGWVLSSGAGSDTLAIHVSTSAEITGIANKPTLVGTDTFVIEDSAAGDAKKNATLDAILALASLADGSRPFTNPVSGVTPTLDAHLVTKGYADSVSQGTGWLPPVLDKDQTTPPGSPATGDRYIVASVATGVWTGQEDDIATWEGSSWDFFTPVEGATVVIEDENKNYRFDGAAWGYFGTTVDHGNLMGLGDIADHPYATLLDGTRDFTGPVIGVTPTLDGHLATRGSSDARYFQQSEFLTTSAGAGDSGKPVKLDAAGHIDASMLNDADIDHGTLGGLGDIADHPYAALVDATRNITGTQTFEQAVIIDGDLAVGDGSTSADIVLDKADAAIGALQFHNEGIRRFYLYLTAGEDLSVNRYAAGTGAFVDTPLTISQSTGNFTLLHDLAAVDGTFSGNVDITSGTLDVGGLATFDGNAILDSASPTLTVGSGGGSPDIILNKTAAGSAETRYQTGGVLDWIVQNDVIESYQILRYVAGSFQDVPFKILNSTGDVTLANNLTVDGQMHAAADSSATVSTNALTLDFDLGNSLSCDLGPGTSTVAITLTNVKEGAVYNVQILGGDNGVSDNEFTIASSGHTFNWGANNTQPAVTESGEWAWYVFNRIGTVIHSRLITSAP